MTPNRSVLKSIYPYFLKWFLRMCLDIYSLWGVNPFNALYLKNALNTYAQCIVDEYMLVFTHFIKLSVTVDFILVNKCQHDPVTNNGTLKKVRWKERTVCGEKSNEEAATSKVTRKKRNDVKTHNPNWSHSRHCADDGWDGTEFTCLQWNFIQTLQ